MSTNRVLKWFLIFLKKFLYILIVLSKIIVEIFLIFLNFLYISRILSKILIKKLLISQNIWKLPVAPSNTSKPLINLNKVSKTLLVPLIYPNITTKGDLRF